MQQQQLCRLMLVPRLGFVLCQSDVQSIVIIVFYYRSWYYVCIDIKVLSSPFYASTPVILCNILFLSWSNMLKIAESDHLQFSKKKKKKIWSQTLRITLTINFCKLRARLVYKRNLISVLPKRKINCEFEHMIYISNSK